MLLQRSIVLTQLGAYVVNDIKTSNIMTHTDNWIGDRFFDGNQKDESINMKPVISKLMTEAFWIAICDCLPDVSDERRIEIRRAHCLTEEEWELVSPGVLIRNTTNRMFGTGCWTVRGKYTAHHTAEEMFRACMELK